MWGHRSMGPACHPDKTRIFFLFYIYIYEKKCYGHTRRERNSRIPREALHRNRTLSRTLTLQGGGGGGAMDGGGAASPDTAICIAPGPGPIVAVPPAGISKLPPTLPSFPSLLAKRISLMPIRAVSPTLLRCYCFLSCCVLDLGQGWRTATCSRAGCRSTRRRLAFRPRSTTP